MKYVAIIAFITLAACSSRHSGPDPSLFPEKSKEYNDGYSSGFKKGFNEGLIYNTLSQ